jgi:NAD(P)-dependent dehydrogenase (short-subunit alcohol dehydrogenase family)
MFKGKTALITGGSSGIGFATAKMMIADGARVAITGTNEAKLQLAVQELGSGAIGIKADVTKAEDLEKMQAQLKNHFAELDIFFANAGIAYATPLVSTNEEEYNRLMDVNVKGVFFSVQAILPLMKSGASIVLNTSWLNEVGTPNKAILSASKAAVRSFARTMSAELIEQGVRVNCVSPGTIITPLHRSPNETDEHFDAYTQRVGNKVPIGRMGKPDEVASAVVFLASDASSYMLGTELIVDGGRSEL